MRAPLWQAPRLSVRVAPYLIDADEARVRSPCSDERDDEVNIIEDGPTLKGLVCVEPPAAEVILEVEFVGLVANQFELLAEVKPCN